MASRRSGDLSKQLQALFQLGTLGGQSDAQLLERFVAGRDEAGEMAFRALVERHGPMVLRVCQSVLRDRHDAEDAFQVTFLVLARKAGSIPKAAIRWRAGCTGWLITSRSGRRTATEAPPAHESKVAEMAAGSPRCPARTAAICRRSSTRRSSGCRPNTGRRSSSATWKG